MDGLERFGEGSNGVSAINAMYREGGIYYDVTLREKARQQLVPWWRYCHVHRSVYSAAKPWVRQFRRDVLDMGGLNREDLIRCHHKDLIALARANRPMIDKGAKGGEYSTAVPKPKARQLE